MKRLFRSQNRIKYLLLFGIVVLALFLNLYKKDSSPPGFNADEAAFGYNAYSLLKTGADEYGLKFPVRLKSFADYKMPLYSYLSVPIVGAMGLSETSTRFLNTIVAVLLPLAVFLLAKEFFKNEKVALLSAFLIPTSLGLSIVGRHAHEAYLFVFLATLTLLFLIRSFKNQKIIDISLTGLLLLLSLFSYQSARVFAVFVFLFSIYYVFKNKISKKIILAIALPLIVFGITDVIYKPVRVQNLLLFNSVGFQKQITQLRDEGGHIFFYNIVNIGIRDVVSQHVKYFSPQFLGVNGDENPRFGFPAIAPFGIVQYVFAFIGIYYLFKNKDKWRWFLVSLLGVLPIAASLSWAEISLTRSLLIFVPLILITSYGVILLIENSRKNRKNLIALGIFLTWVFFSFYSWDFYLNHYAKRGLAIRHWQAGYEELVSYLKSNYNEFEHFYISRKHGQPYIFTLFYMNYPPSKYQNQANLSEPDEYGFGQVEAFDKFDFHFEFKQDVSNISMIGYPDDYIGTGIESQNVKKIVVGGEEIFWIYEKP